MGLTFSQIAIYLVWQEDVVLDVQVAKLVVTAVQGHALTGHSFNVSRLSDAASPQCNDMFVEVGQVPLEAKKGVVETNGNGRVQVSVLSSELSLCTSGAVRVQGESVSSRLCLLHRSKTHLSLTTTSPASKSGPSSLSPSYTSCSSSLAPF
jgi:hypothetical protein